MTPNVFICPYGHGELLEVPGWWVLQGVAPKVATGLLSALTKPGALELTGKALALQAWRCPQCNAVQLFDVKVE